ncbi:unnamed protein product [Rotaria sordida]|uniref:Uncharacterized protein n=1 Tax=Rotaria sordida TaxID=392033 RepID=A0A818Q182_9BILA|nr:unnamed protein product [Rotaria sordida]CAF3633095.1 unnamed protein product [Rotaria sordida]
MISKLAFLTTIFYILIQLDLSAGKICYQCDDLHPSSRFKFWGDKITKCTGVPFDKYITRTSRAFGAAVLTCYTKFDESGAVIKRDAYGLGETFDKNVKCRDRFHTCCSKPLCNKHTKAPCPPPERITEKKEVKACYQCKGAENCRPENLEGSEIRTSAAFGSTNLYCYTRFDPKTGVAVRRGGFGFGEIFDKRLKCDAKFYLCCYENLCNKHTAGFCAKPNPQVKNMDPLNNMCAALVSVNNILQKRKQTMKDTCIESNMIEKVNNKKQLSTDASLSSNITNTKYQTSTISQFKLITNKNQNKSHHLHFESLTEDNFHYAHLCNRSIDELPNVHLHDIKQLKLINIHTMQDLLGRFLIHDTPEEFYTFLMNTFQLSEKTASIITNLLHRWTKHNIDTIIDNKNIDPMKIVH